MRRSFRRPAASSCALLVVLSAMACSVTSKTFYSNPSGVSDLRLCRTARSLLSVKNDFQRDVFAEAKRRNLTYERCEQLIRQQEAAVLGALVIGAAAVDFAEGGGGSGSQGYVAQDYDWAWDQLYDQ